MPRYEPYLIHSPYSLGTLPLTVLSIIYESTALSIHCYLPCESPAALAEIRRELLLSKPNKFHPMILLSGQLNPVVAGCHSTSLARLEFERSPNWKGSGAGRVRGLLEILEIYLGRHPDSNRSPI